MKWEFFMKAEAYNRVPRPTVFYDVFIIRNFKNHIWERTRESKEQLDES